MAEHDHPQERDLAALFQRAIDLIFAGQHDQAAALNAGARQNRRAEYLLLKDAAVAFHCGANVVDPRAFCNGVQLADRHLRFPVGHL